MGGGGSFWTSTDNDTTVTNVDIVALWAYYFNKNFLFEIEPRTTLHFREDEKDISGLLLAGLSHRIVDLTNYDRQSASQWQRKMEQSTGGIYFSAGAGLWVDNAKVLQTEQVYSGLAVSAGVGTHSLMGSLTKIRSKFQYVYLFPTGPVFEKPRSMFTFSVIFSVITIL